MHRQLLFILAVILSLQGQAQNIPLIHSGKILDEGKALYDSGRYEEAAKLFLAVPSRDTNYVAVQTELALTYNALKDSQKALEACERGLAKKSTMRAHLLKSRAIATDYSGDFDKSIALFKQAIEEYPFDYTLYFNMGITYYNYKQYDSAEACFLKAIRINPFHANSHLNLANVSINKGRRTHAMFAMGMYLSIAPSDNRRLVTMNKFLGNELADDGSIPATGANGGEKLDQIIRARIAMEDKFKSTMPLKAAVVKQYEMFFQQLSLISTTANDPFVDYYLPIYTAIQKQGFVEPFLYNTISSADNDDVKQWIKKHKDELGKFYSLGNVELKKTRTYVTPPASLGFDGPVQAWYSDEGSRPLEAIGREEANDVKQGLWVYYYANGEKSAVGKYNDKGQKIGTWKYFHRNGNPSGIEVIETGEVTHFREDGAKTERFTTLSTGIQGPAETFFPCGQIKEKISFDKGKRHGKSETLYPNGKVDATYHYADDKLEGESLTYFEDGKLFSRLIYKNNLREGKYDQYYANGKLQMTGSFVGGKGDGEWRYYYQNGFPEKHGKFLNDEYVGEWTFYDKNGVITEKQNYNNEGVLDGEDILYHDGRKLSVIQFRKGITVAFEYFDEEGKSLGKFANDQGNMRVQSFFPTGERRSEGEFKNGVRHGAWKYYYRSGAVLSEYQYVDGKLNGPGKEYYKDGATKLSVTYADDELHGYYQEFYIHGQIKEEGWYQHGKPEQQWIEYHPNGTTASDRYFLDGELKDEYYEFTTDGKLRETNWYDQGIIQRMEYRDQNNKPISRVRKEGNQEFFEVYYDSKALAFQQQFMCGENFGKTVSKYPDGKIRASYAYVNGLHGPYQLLDIDGTVLVEGNYMNGSASGMWRANARNGVPVYSGYYFRRQQDSLWNYYHPNGKLQSTGNFSNDDRDGISTTYGPTGELIFQKLYDDGDLISYRLIQGNGQWGEWKKHKTDEHNVYTYANGTKGFEETFKNDLLEGKRIFYYPDGKIFSEYSFKNGDHSGPFVIYYPNGKVMEKGNYKFDELDGAHEYFNPDGTPKRSENYLLGKTNGKTILYNDKGVKIKEVNFWAGEPVN